MGNGVWFAVAVFTWAVAGPAYATCACQCVEGVPRTACTSVDEARANPHACGANGRTIACATPPAREQPPERYAAPDGAVDCRAGRLWDPHTNAYSVVAKVCDLAPVDAAP
jgi:hypothetical protein